MSFLRTETGCWINLSFCNRVYIAKNADGFSIRATVDHGEVQESMFILE